MALRIAQSYKELITEAKEAEAKDDLQTATKAYERAIKQEPLEELSYNRLMIIYRKLYEYEKELKLIEKAISTFEAYYKKKSQNLLKKKKTAEQLSKSLAKALGLTDKKGNDVYHPKPIETWMKRKIVVEKKLGK